MASGAETRRIAPQLVPSQEGSSGQSESSRWGRSGNEWVINGPASDEQMKTIRMAIETAEREMLGKDIKQLREDNTLFEAAVKSGEEESEE